ncbi:MAG TPA: 4Fe-4S dicluster domain-containing protein [Syntrophomonadaceae bacterium]|nr:4Fe-4S dicluster domain-containing protein [Syntrophomonadaceae bacterium]
MTTPKTVFVDTLLCTGCKACSVACKSWNELPAEETKIITSYQSQADYTYDTWTYVSMHEKYEDGKMEWLMFKHQCYHCEDPACMKACPSEAIYKTDSGYTIIDQEKCIGCGYCTASCPWGVPKTNTEINKTFKCTGCIDRVENGLKPACVAICQSGALKFGERDEMHSLAKARLTEVKKEYPKAQLYGDNLMGGTTYLYLLLDEPQVYGIPAKPATSWSLPLWKNVVHPLGGIAIGGAALAVTAGVVANLFRGNYRSKSKDSDNIAPPQ